MNSLKLLFKNWCQSCTSVSQRRYIQSIVKGNEKCSTPSSRGLVLGVYANPQDYQDIGCLTPNGSKYSQVKLFFLFFYRKLYKLSI